MTVPARNTPNVTDGDDVCVRVRASGDAVVRPIRPGMDDSSAYTRAIPRSPRVIKTDATTKVRNFVSTHAGEAGDALAGSWLANGHPQPLGELTRDALRWRGGPVNGLTGLLLGLFRAGAYSLAYLICFAVDTRTRAAVTLTLTALSLTAAWAASTLTH